MEIGPVDVVVLAFPGNQFNGAILPALADLVSSGTIRLLDLMFVFKDEEGAVGALQVGEIIAQHGPVPLADQSTDGFLDAEYVAEVAADLAPNLLGELMGGTVRRCGGGFRGSGGGSSQDPTRRGAFGHRRRGRKLRSRADGSVQEGRKVRRGDEHGEGGRRCGVQATGET